MEYLDFINDFFSQVQCANCHEYFKDDSVQVVRQESNNIVVRIGCSKCGKHLGLAILGIDRAEYKNSLKLSEETSDTAGEQNIPVLINNEAEPITYDDVIKAHEFFSNLGDDWAKNLHLPDTEK